MNIRKELLLTIHNQQQLFYLSLFPGVINWGAVNRNLILGCEVIYRYKTVASIGDDGRATYRYKNPSYVGQCTWYAAGRFREVTGIDIYKRNSEGNSLSGQAGGLRHWVDVAKSDEYPGFTGVTDLKEIQPNSFKRDVRSPLRGYIIKKNP